MVSSQRTPIVRSNLAHKISFIRGDHPEYGVLTKITIAKDRQAAIEHTMSCYGKGTIIVDEEESRK